MVFFDYLFLMILLPYSYHNYFYFSMTIQESNPALDLRRLDFHQMLSLIVTAFSVALEPSQPSLAQWHLDALHHILVYRNMHQHQNRSLQSAFCFLMMLILVAHRIVLVSLT